MAQVLAAVPSAGLQEVLMAVDLVVESGALSAEHVLNVLARLTASPRPETVDTTLQLQEAPQANTGRYDSLRGELEAPQEASVAAVPDCWIVTKCLHQDFWPDCSRCDPARPNKHQHTSRAVMPGIAFSVHHPCSQPIGFAFPAKPAPTTPCC